MTQTIDQDTQVFVLNSFGSETRVALSLGGALTVLEGGENLPNALRDRLEDDGHLRGVQLMETPEVNEFFQPFTIEEDDLASYAHKHLIGVVKRIEEPATV